MYKRQIFLLLLTGLLLSGTVKAEKVIPASQQKISINLSNVSLQNILWEVEKLCDIKFICDTKDAQSLIIPSIKVENVTVPQILDICLANSNLTYEIKYDTIVILKKQSDKNITVLETDEKEKSSEEKLLTKQAVAGDIQKEDVYIIIKGQVLNEAKEPVIGASIVEKDQNTGTTADINGQFEIRIKDVPTAILEFSMIGMQTKMEMVRGRSTINVILLQDVQEIEAVVVTGYGNISKESYTGSASVINSSNIENRSIASFEEAIRGISPGAIVTGSGQPGEESAIRLRGFGSMNASNQPLFVIDGVIWDQVNMSGDDYSSSNPLVSLNPSDIANMTILKDAASASLYGSRGANGVIVITTKQGIANEKLSVQFSLQGGFANMTGQPDLTSGEEYATLWTEGQMNYLLQQEISRKRDGSVSVRAELVDELKKLYADKIDYTYSGKNYYEWQKLAQYDFNSKYQMPTSDGGYRYYDYFGEDRDKLPNVDWFREVSRLAPFAKANVTIRGGGKSIKYYSSLEYFNQQGTIINSKLKRYALRIKLSSENNEDFINWGVNSYLAHTDQSGPAVGAQAYSSPQYASILLPPVVPAYLEDGSYNFAFPDNILNTTFNPIAGARLNTTEKPITNANVQAWIQLNICNWLKFKSTGSLNYLGLRRHYYYSKDFGQGLSRNGELTERDVHRRKITNSNMFFVDKSFNNKHRIFITAGVELEDMHYSHNQVVVSGFASDDYPNISTGSTVSSWSGDSYAYSLFSIVSKADYSYLNRYFVSGSYRRDYSSMFAPQYRAGNFWSVSAAYDIMKEKFMRRASNVLYSMKIKGSYGINGTLPSEYYYWRETFQSTRYAQDLGAYSAYRYRENLTWEGNKIWNIGLETSFLKNRITFGIEYYERISNNLIQDVPVSMSSGYETMLKNSKAGIRNKGLEVDIDATVIEKNKWIWDVNFNIATLSSVYYGLESQYMDAYNRQLIANGVNVYSWYLKTYKGINSETGLPQYLAYDDNGEEYITTSSADAKYSVTGSGVPKVTGGLSSTLSYGNWKLYVLCSYALGHYIYDRMGGGIISTDGGSNNSISYTQLDRWTPDHTDATSPLRINNSTIFSRSTRYLVKGDYLKLKSAKVEYRFPSKMTQKAKISRLSIYVQAENPLIWSHFKDYDPEMSMTGYRYYDLYPTASTFTLGINISF